VKVIDVENPESAIVFCNTREATERVAGHLQREGFGADWLNGDLPQSDREKVMRATREGRLRFLVATDVAARGIDISHLTHVINFDFPQDAESYVHRTGRTGRAGRTGTAVSLVQPRDIGALYLLRLTYKIRPVERQLPTASDQRTRMEADVVSALAEAFVPLGRDTQDRALARRLLTHPQVEGIVAGMLREHLAARPAFSEEAGARRREQLPEPVAEPEQRKSAPRKARQRKSEQRGVEPQPSDAGERKPRAKRERRGTVAKSKQSKPRDSAPDTVRESQPPPFDAPEGGAEAAADAPEPRASKPRASKPRASKPGAKKSSERASRPGRKKAPEARASKPGKRGKLKAPKQAGVDEPPAPAKSSSGRGKSGGSKAGRSGAKSSPGVEGDSLELHLTVGRRDGARAGDIRAMLKESGLPSEAVGRIRVRERYCFVEVALDQVDSALEVLDGASLGDGKASATISERSRS
jgi:ATP-dependent RNA helicase DeaD